MLLHGFFVFWLKDWLKLNHSLAHADHITQVQAERSRPWKISVLLLFHNYLLYQQAEGGDDAAWAGEKKEAIKKNCADVFFTFHPFFWLVFFFFLSPSAGLSSSDPSELPQPGHPVRPEVAEAGGRAGGGEARGSGGLSEGSGDEGGVWAAEGGDEAAAEQPEGEGQCLFTQILVNHNSDVSNWEKGSNQSEHVYILVAVWPQPDSGVAPNQQCVHHHLYPRNTNSQKIHLDLNKGLVTTEYRTGLAQMLTQLVDFYQHDSLSLNKRRAECHIVGPILTPQCFCTHHQLVVCLSPVTNSY